MHFRASIPGSRFNHNAFSKALMQDRSYVLQTLDFNSFRLRTYAVVEAALKTRDFILFRMRTYAKMNHNSFEFRTYKKAGLNGTPRHQGCSFHFPVSNCQNPGQAPKRAFTFAAAAKAGLIFFGTGDWNGAPR